MRELREVLEGLLTEDESVRLNVQVLAPIIDTALRATARKMAIDYGTWYYDESEIRDRIDKCVTAGVAAMMEKPNE